MTTQTRLRACIAADAAFGASRDTAPNDCTRFLDALASGIEGLADELVERAVAESGLAPARLTGERGRATGQLRLFAALLRRGDWAQVMHDTAMLDRQPLPHANSRQQRIAPGPVAAFGPTNSLLTFSVSKRRHCRGYEQSRARRGALTTRSVARCCSAPPQSPPKPTPRSITKC